MKKAQITIFIILAVIILALITGVFLIYNNDIIGISDESQINSFVNSCLDQSLVRSFNDFSLQATNYENNLDFGNSIFLNITYYYYEGENRLPKIDELEIQLEIYSEKYFEECVNGFEDFKEQGFQIKEGNKEFGVIIKDKIVEIKLDYPLTVTKDRKTTELRNFKSKLDFDFMKIYRILEGFIQEHDKGSNYIPIGYIGVLSAEENILIQMGNFPDDSVLYYFLFNDIYLESNPYEIYFVIKYNWEELEEVINGNLL